MRSSAINAASLLLTHKFDTCRYAQFGDVSPKVDVYAFGVVLYELISAKEAIVRTGTGTESVGLVALVSFLLLISYEASFYILANLLLKYGLEFRLGDPKIFLLQDS